MVALWRQIETIQVIQINTGGGSLCIKLFHPSNVYFVPLRSWEIMGGRKKKGEKPTEMKRNESGPRWKMNNDALLFSLKVHHLTDKDSTDY